MKQTVTLYDFRDAVERMGRDTHFTYSGLEVLFRYLEDLEDQLGEELEFDVIALCCDYAEYSPEEIADLYGIDISDLTDPADIFERVGEYVGEHGAYCGVTEDGNIVYQQF